MVAGIIGLVLGAGNSLADPALEAVLAGHCRARESIVAMKTEFTQRKQFRLFGEEEVSTGTVHYLSPDRICWQYAQPDTSQTVIHGKRGWTVLPDIRQVQSFKLEGSAADRVLSIVGFGACRRPLEEAFSIDLRSGEPGGYLLEMTPTDPGIVPYFSRIDLTLNQSDFLPRRVALLERGGDVLLFEFGEPDLTGVSDSTLFEFTVPDGFEVVEY